jgi:putative nucleotidyltransferase with HDIG domain
MATREEAWQLVNEYTASVNLVRHMLAVETAMRAYARKYGEDEELWGLVGLIHDFDYERYPDLSVEGHPVVGARILREQSWPEEVVRAMLAHAGEYTGVPPESRMEKALVSVDELTGFLVAVALVRPTKDIRDITKISSVRKKWKDRSFAAAVSRGRSLDRARAPRAGGDEGHRVRIGVGRRVRRQPLISVRVWLDKLTNLCYNGFAFIIRWTRLSSDSF